MRKRAYGGGLVFDLCRANHFGGHPHSAAIHGVSRKDPAKCKNDDDNRDGDCRLDPPMHAARPRGFCTLSSDSIPSSAPRNVSHRVTGHK